MRPEADSKPIDRQEQIKQEAGGLLNELNQFSGRKALILIVDDEAKKISSTTLSFKINAERRNMRFSIKSAQKGEEAIEFYEAFRQLETTPNTVITVLDGYLTKHDYDPAFYKRGIEVAHKIAEISMDNGWPMPLFLGHSASLERNEELQQAYPNHYITGFEFRESLQSRVFDEIDSRLK